MSIDVARVRADTPGSTNVLHFDNAGSSLPPTSTLEAVKGYLDLEASVGGYQAVEVAADDIEFFYTSSARLLGCEPGEVAFQSGASEAWWRAFLAVDPKPGDRVLVGTTEYQAAAFGLMQASKRGVIVEMIPDDAHGQIDVEALQSMLAMPTKLVCLTQIGLSNGLVNPAAEVGEIVKDSGALYLLDACQAVGQMPLDVDELQCDFLTATGRKWLRGPRGTGLLYVRGSILGELADPVFVDGKSALWNTTNTYELASGSSRYELYEMNPAGKVGLGAAIAYALDVGVEAIEERVKGLAAMLRERLRVVPTIAVIDRGSELSGIVSFVSDTKAAAEIGEILLSHNINVSALGAQSSRYMFEALGVETVVRASPHYYNTEEEIDRFVDVVGSIVAT